MGSAWDSGSACAQGVAQCGAQEMQQAAPRRAPRETQQLRAASAAGEARGARQVRGARAG